MTHPHTKLFDLASAKAGAPIGLLQGDGGYKLEILKYGDKKIFGILTDWKGDESADFWQLNGRYGSLATADGPLTLVMLPLGYCEGKPVFWDSEMIHKDGTPVVGRTAYFHSADGYNNYTWPKREPNYPETRMIKDELSAVIDGQSKMVNGTNLAEVIANAAIKRAIQDGDVFTKQQVTAVLEKLRAICEKQVNPYNIRTEMDSIDWDYVLKTAM